MKELLDDMRLSKPSSTDVFALDDSGQLSIDFIVGFAIFMAAFIMVITLSSGLLVGLQSRHVDYDAVAYRAGVILSERPRCTQYLAWVTHAKLIWRMGIHWKVCKK